MTFTVRHNVVFLSIGDSKMLNSNLTAILFKVLGINRCFDC